MPKTNPYVLAAVLAMVALGAQAKEEKAEALKPFGGTPQVIPGVVEAEHYDEGAPDVAYHDVDPQNQGVAYRGETQVDIEKRPDASNGHGIGWVREGEWVHYTVEVKEAGEYALEIPVASNKAGGTFHIEIDGADVTGAITIPDTGGWDKLKTVVAKTVALEPGVVPMRIVMDKDGESGGIGDIDLVRFTKVIPTN